MAIPGIGSSLAGALVNHTTFQILMGASKSSLVDVTATVPPLSMLKIHYIDPISWEADTIDLIFMDVKDQIINNSKIAKGIWMKVKINQYSRDYPGSHTQKDLGSFMIDQIKQSGPPTQTVIMASSLPIDSQIKYTLKNKTRFTTSIQGLLNDVAKENGLTPVYNVPNRPLIPLDQAEQWNESDLQMLARYCKSNALCLKMGTNGTLIVFDEQDLEQKPPVYTIDFKIAGAGVGMTHWELTTQSQDIYSQSIMAWHDPATNQVIYGRAKAPKGTATGNGDVLMIYDHPNLVKSSGGEDIEGAT